MLSEWLLVGFDSGTLNSPPVSMLGLALEVKAGNRRQTLPGMVAFDKAFAPTRKYLVGTGEIPFEEFFTYPVADLFA